VQFENLENQVGLEQELKQSAYRTTNNGVSLTDKRHRWETSLCATCC